MKEQIEQLNHLAEVLYNESRGFYTVDKYKAAIYQSILDEMQELVDGINHELNSVELS